MKFGLFYEQQLPKPWDDGAEEKLFAETLEEIALADSLGYDALWVAEHHFLPEYSHCSSPEMLLAAASQRTRNMRLGQGIVQATTNHPARIVEKTATLDVLSGGRAELGLGEGQGMVELEPFGVEMEEKRDRFEDAVRAVTAMFNDETAGYEGPYCSMPPRSIVPRPVQKPHPPLWVACTRTKTIRDAGAWGMGVLGFAFASPERANVWVGAYYNELLRRPRRLAAYQLNPNIAVSTYMMCAPTVQEAQQRFATGSFFEFVLSRYGRKHMLGSEISLWDQYVEWCDSPEGRELQAEPRGLVGDPEHLRGMVQEMADTHIDQLIMVVQAGRTRHEDICQSLELFAEEVMPHFADQRPQEEWKAAVLSGELELVDPPDDQLSVDGDRMAGAKTPA